MLGQGTYMRVFLHRSFGCQKRITSTYAARTFHAPKAHVTHIHGVNSLKSVHFILGDSSMDKETHVGRLSLMGGHACVGLSIHTRVVDDGHHIVMQKKSYLISRDVLSSM